MPKKNSVPYGWRSLQAVGLRMVGTRFIPFKVPLKGVINQRLTPNQKFTPKDLIAEIRAQGEELGIVIDLTNTNRYYEVKDLPKNVSYQKLPTAGLEVPDEDAILQFKKIVRKFLRQNQHNDKLVGVHCTTGLSRTGYLICRYLVDVDGWNPDVAMKAFQDTRGLPLDGRVYVADLKVGKHRTNEGIDDFDPDEEGGPVTVPQYDDPARAEWSEGAFHGGQPQDDFKGQRDLGPGDALNPFQDNQALYGLNEKMRMEGYEVFNKPDPRQRTVHGRLSNDGDQAPKRNFEEDFHTPLQRTGPFPDERYDFESGRNLEMYNSQHFSRQSHDSMSFEELKGQKPVDEKPFYSSRPEQRTRPFPLETREFREGGSQDVYPMPQGQRKHYDYSGDDDFKAQGQLEENDFHNNRPGPRLRPLVEGESRGFPPERVRNVFDSTPGQRPKPLINDFQAERQTEDGLGNRVRSFHALDSRNSNMDAQTEDGEFPNYGPGQGLRRYSGPQGRPIEAVQAEEDFSKRGYQQRQPPYGHPSSHGFQNDAPLEDNFYSDRDFGQRRRPFNGPQSRDLEMDSQMGNRDVSNSENQLRMRLPPGSHSPHFKMAPEIEDTDFVSSGLGRRGKPFHDFAPHDLKPEESGFPNSGPGPRQRSLFDHQMEMQDRGYTRQGPRLFEGQTQSSFPPEQYSESGPSYPASSKRMRLSDELGLGDRFAPYASQGQSMGQTENQRRYERPPFDRLNESTSAPFNYGHGVAERQKFTTEGNVRERPALPRKSRFN